MSKAPSAKLMRMLRESKDLGAVYCKASLENVGSVEVQFGVAPISIPKAKDTSKETDEDDDDAYLSS